jgi:vacuolar-type H+-ATPase subunit H
MFGTHRKHADGGAEASALDALLEAERTVAARLQDAERDAERLVREARAAVRAADEEAETKLQDTLRSLDVRAVEQREADARGIREEAERRRRLYADASDARIAEIAERLLTLVAPVAES